MSDPMFYSHPVPMSIEEVAAFCKGEIANLSDDINIKNLIKDVAPIDDANLGQLAFIDNPRYAPILSTTKASAVLISKKYLDRVPSGTAAIVVAEPYRAYASILAKLYPQSMRPQAVLSQNGISPAAHVSDDAQIEEGVTVEAGAVIGAGAEIGTGTLVCAGAVIGANVRVGRNVTIGANATVIHALIGNEVIIHSGVAIGQDGFGFAMGFGGHQKVPQIGRVIIQDKVEIGANSCVDRGANRDTVIGEGTKIDNMVQIGHNVVVGSHCILVSKVAIAGSTTLGDYVAIGGHTAVAGHLTIGDGAQIAASSGIANDVPAGARWGGTPARYVKHWLRDVAKKRSEARQMEQAAKK